MSNYTETLNNYKVLNEAATSRAVVFFGTDWLCDIPVAELTRDSGIDAAVYNRSLKGLTLKDSQQVVDTCVNDLHPDKVFINIGENDICCNDFDPAEFSEKFEWLLYTINAKCRCNIYILSVINDKGGLVNEILKKIAEKYGCEYIDIQACRTSFLKFFSKVRFFLRRNPITFYEAMNL